MRSLAIVSFSSAAWLCIWLWPVSVALCAPRIQELSLRTDGILRFDLSMERDSNYTLYFRRQLNDSSGEFPVAMVSGDADVSLNDHTGVRGAQGFYRVVESHRNSGRDIDGDGRSDTMELEDITGRLSALNSADPVSVRDGVTIIRDHEEFRRLSYKGREVLRDAHLEALEFVKFYVIDASSPDPKLYFMNTELHRSHGFFAEATGLTPTEQGNLPDSMRGEIVYHPLLAGPGGVKGVYRFEFQPFDAFPIEDVEKVYELLARNMPFLQNNLYYYPLPGAALPVYRDEKDLYDASRIKVLLEEDLYKDISYLPLNSAVGYGRLRLVKPGERPGAQEIVIYEHIPNELPRVSGVITSEPQTPLSHVNLRAIQDKIPNAYILDADKDETFVSLLGKYVRLSVSPEGFEIEEVTLREVEEHQADKRPQESQIPERDLNVKDIADLDNIGFHDSKAFGVKAANLAELRSFDFRVATVPDGFAVPFYFYDEFMKHNGFYSVVEDLLEEPRFHDDLDYRVKRLKALRNAIKDAAMPDWMSEAIGNLHAAFPDGTTLRCRSSTNNEDLPDFSGAGLYESYTHHLDEGHLSKSIKQVFASMWTFRAFDEREYYRIDHFRAAMGVLVHSNFSDEQANGVAVTDDPLYQSLNNYYINAQVGEQLITNPGEGERPEELLMNKEDSDQYTVIQFSSEVEENQRILSSDDLRRLRVALNSIHNVFRIFYQQPVDSGFAMEIEFKVDVDGELVIKQARPWIR